MIFYHYSYSWINDDKGKKMKEPGLSYLYYDKSSGNPYCLKQILNVKMENKNASRNFNTVFGVSHSKWAISNNSKLPYVIFGSSNMQESQARRGSDFYAINNLELWKSFYNIVNFKGSTIVRNNITNCSK